MTSDNEEDDRLFTTNIDSVVSIRRKDCLLKKGKKLKFHNLNHATETINQLRNDSLKRLNQINRI